MASTELTIIERQLTTLRPAFVDLLKPTGVPAERIIRSVVISCERTPKLRECTLPSILQAATTGAVLGLEADGVTGQGFLVPFNNRRAQVKLAQWITGYKGYNTLGARVGLTINGDVVREGDDFDFELGTRAFVHHKPKLGAGHRRIIGAWATATALDRPPIVMVLDIDEINAVKGKSSAARAEQDSDGFSPWADERVGFPAMAAKTAKRRLARSLPLSAYAWASRIDEAYDEEGRRGYMNLNRELVIEGEAQPIGGVDPTPGPTLDQLRQPIFVIKGVRGERRFNTIEQWRGAMISAIQEIKSRDALERFRDLNLPILDDLRDEHQEHVRAITHAFEERMR